MRKRWCMEMTAGFSKEEIRRKLLWLVDSAGDASVVLELLIDHMHEQERRKRDAQKAKAETEREVALERGGAVAAPGR
jgi:hypothetical protein